MHNIKLHPLLLSLAIMAQANIETTAAVAPSPHVAVTAVTPAQASLSVSNAGGKRFTVQSRSGLEPDATWVNVSASIRDSGTNNLVNVPAVPGFNRYYRVKNDTGENNGGSVLDSSRIAVIHLTVGESNLNTMYATVGSGSSAGDSIYVPCTFAFDVTNVVANVGIRFKGNASFNRTGSSDPYYKPYKIDFDRYVVDQKFKGLKKLNLHVANSTPTNAALNEFIVYGIWRDYGVPAPRTGWAEVWLDGRLLGLYTTVEQVDSRFLSRTFDYPEGNLYKPDLPAGSLAWAGTNFNSYTNANFERGDDTNHVDFMRLLDTINHRPVAKFHEVLDVQSALANYAGNIATANWDNYSTLGHNYYLYLGAPGRFYMIPWDVNESLGLTTNIWTSDIPFALVGVNTNNLPPGSEIPTNGLPNFSFLTDTNRPLTARLLSAQPYRTTYLNILDSFLRGPASVESINARVDAALAVLAPRVHPAEAFAIRSNAMIRVNAMKANVQSARNAPPGGPPGPGGP